MHDGAFTTSSSQLPRDAFRAPHRLLSLPDGELAYYRFGRGPDVVAVHGWPLHAATWRALVPLLAERFTVHLFDLPGAGHTRWRKRPDFAADTAALRAGIDALGLSRYALLAHDSGGVFARRVAAEDPRVRALVLAGSEIPGHHSKLLALFALLARAPGGGWLLARSLQLGPVRRSPLGFATCFEDPRSAEGDFYELFVRPLLDPAVLRGQLGLLETFDFREVDALAEVHARITAPTLCVWGERDPFFPAPKARAMLSQFAGPAEFVEVPRARLYLHEDHAPELAAHAGPFLARHLA